MYRVRIFVCLKKSVSDPQGMTIQSALTNLFQESSVKNVRVGKAIDLVLNHSFSEEEMKKTIEQMCDQFLVNKVIEDYQFEWEKIDSSPL